MKEKPCRNPIVEGYLSLCDALKRDNSPAKQANLRVSQAQMIDVMQADDFRELANRLEQRRLNDRKAIRL